MKLIYTISAPSGTGKSTLCKAILKEIPELSFSVSYTTRLQRDKEINGVDYNFVSHADELSLADVVSQSDLTVFHIGSFIQSVVYHSVSQIHTAIKMC